MTDEMTPALTRLQAKLQTELDLAKRTKKAINALHEAFDRPIPYPDVDQEDAIKTIRRGMFYGQPLATCVRTILDMRRAAQLDAGSVNEIFAALKEGGYAFDTKDDENAKSGLRQSMRKNPIFHRIPSGEWGLLAWYPNAKIEKEDDDDANGGSGKKAEKPVATATTPAPTNETGATSTTTAAAKPRAKREREKLDDPAGGNNSSPSPSNDQAASAT